MNGEDDTVKYYYMVPGENSTVVIFEFMGGCNQIIAQREAEEQWGTEGELCRVIPKSERPETIGVHAEGNGEKEEDKQLALVV